APPAGINPAPQVTQPSRSWRWRRSDLCGAVAQVGISAPSAGINPAPQIPRPRRNWRWRRTLWGRLYAGQRRWGRCPSGDFSAVGRDKPGPTGFEAAPELVAAQDPVGPALRRPAEVGPLPKWGFQRRRPG